LDVEINSITGRLSLYRKPMFSFNYVSATSKHPRHALIAWIRNEFHRILLICNNPCDYYLNARNFRSKLLNLHYGLNDCIIPPFSQSDRIHLLTKKPMKLYKSSLHWITWPYEAKGYLSTFLELVKSRSIRYNDLDTGSFREAITLNSNLLEECRNFPGNF
jgi:hypothetical protein